MTEVILFLIVGGIAIAAAMLMLLSENAIHSALFLIVNFACIAFFFLMLDAPFLAMIQIAVYTGAIMVLFLFVIMLLGAEKLNVPTRQFRWLPMVSLALAAGFLLITGAAIAAGQIDLTPTLTRPPILRVVNAAGDVGAVDAYLNGEPIVENLAFGESNDFTTVAAGTGDYTLSFNQAGTDTVIASQDVSLTHDTDRTINTFTALLYNMDSTPTVVAFADDLESTEARSGRVTVYNAYSQPIDLVSYGLPNDTTDDKTLVDDLPPGESVIIPDVSETAPVNTWVFTSADEATSLYPLSNPEEFGIKRSTAELLVLTTQPVFDGSARVVALPLISQAAASFGGPQAIGQLLFTQYMLPFQLIALLLLTAMIGAIVLTHKEGAVPRRRDVRRVVSKTLANAISAQTGSDLQGAPADEPPALPPEHQPEPAGD